MVTDHNNLRWFINTKSLSFCQVRLAQELSQYYFQIDYHQEKANGAVHALSCFPWKNQAEENKLQTENTCILYKLQFSLTNASPSGLNISVKLLLLHRILICRTYVLLQLRHFWTIVQSKLANEGLYKVSISGMRLRLAELQESDNEARIIRAERLKNGYEKVDGILHYQRLPFVPEII